MANQFTHSDYQGVTLAALYRDKVAVTCVAAEAHPEIEGPLWTLPHLARVEGLSPADTALRLVHQTLGFELPVTRLNWPILRVAEDTDAGQRPDWFFAAWLSPMEWDVLTRRPTPDSALMISIPVYLAAKTAIPAQQDSLRHYLSQSKSAPGA